MADNKSQTQPESTLSGRDLDLIKTLISEVVRETKKPFVDEDLAAKKHAARLRMRREQQDMLANLAAMQSQCSHLRDDNTSTVAWAENFHKAKGLWVKEGPCQRCGLNFQPGVPGYEEIIRVSTGKMGVIY